jgi:hypothetical protein
MDADFSIELGNDDPVLDFPWTDPAGKLAYLDLKRHPELIAKIEEAQRFPELKEFLCAVNSPRTAMETAKCDAWATTDIGVDEEIYESSCKFASYVDVVFCDAARRLFLSEHEDFAGKLVKLLACATEVAATLEACIRRCYFVHGGSTQDGFYCTIYVSGFGSDENDARQQWRMGLKLAQNALIQLSAEIE